VAEDLHLADRPAVKAAYAKSGARGDILNFNVKNLSSQGIMRKVNKFPE